MTDSVPEINRLTIDTLLQGSPKDHIKWHSINFDHQVTAFQEEPAFLSNSLALQGRISHIFGSLGSPEGILKGGNSMYLLLTTLQKSLNMINGC